MLPEIEKSLSGKKRLYDKLALQKVLRVAENEITATLCHFRDV